MVIDFFVGHSEISTGDDNGFQYFYLDLSEDEDWNDHQDKIKSIDNIGFQLWVTNNGASETTGQLFISASGTTYADTAEVRDSATLVLDGLILPPGPTYVDWPTSLNYLQNISTLKEIVKGGHFHGYALTTTLPFNITVDSARVIVTVTVGI